MVGTENGFSHGSAMERVYPEALKTLQVLLGAAPGMSVLQLGSSFALRPPCLLLASGTRLCPTNAGQACHGTCHWPALKSPGAVCAFRKWTRSCMGSLRTRSEGSGAQIGQPRRLDRLTTVDPAAAVLVGCCIV